MELILNILAGVIAGILLTTLTFYWRRVSYFFRFGPIRKVWSPFLDGDTVVLLTGRPGSLPRSTTKVSFSEVKAVQKLMYFFREFGVNFTTYTSIDTELNCYAEKNIVLLGSQYGNKVTEKISDRIMIPIEYDDSGNLIINNRKYETVLDTDFLVKSDYALIVKCPNPSDNDKKMLILAGNHGVATESATRFISSKSGFNKIAKELGNSDFIAVIRTEVDNKISQNPKLEFLMKFELS